MRLQGIFLNFVLNFLIGVAWGVVFLGAFSFGFPLNYENIPFTVISIVIGMVPGLLLVVLLEHLITSKEKFAELKKQTLLLQKLLDEKESKLP